MTPDRRTAQKHGPFTTWQWAVIGAYLVAIVLSFVAGQAARQAIYNTDRIDQSICAEIKYLERIASGSDNPNSALQLQLLVKDLRKLTPSCPPSQPPVEAPTRP